MNKFYLYYSLVSTISFLFGSVTFFCVYKNVSGGIWAAFAGCVAGICFQLYKLYFDNKLQTSLSLKSLDYLAIGSFIAWTIGWVFTIWYSFAIVYWRIPMKPYSESLIFSCVFSFLTGKWGYHLHRAAKKCSRELMSSNYSQGTQYI